MAIARDERKPRLPEIAATFLKLGALSYGGPAIMGIMQTEIQDKRQWMSKARFLEGLALVNMLPGPVATQLGIFIGYERAGWRGGVVAGVCFVLPAFAILMTLTLFYSVFGSVGVARDAFYGIGPVVLGIFFVALWRLAKTALKSFSQCAIASVTALAIAFSPVGIAPALLLAGCVGVTLHHSRRWGLVGSCAVLAAVAAVHGFYVPAAGALPGDNGAPGVQDLALFFLEVGAFTFGGGITVLAFLQDQVVSQLHWLSPREFLDGLALGQLTPGPLLMLAAFVGYKTAGAVGAAVSALAIFLPAFVVMLSILPVMARLRHVLWLKAAMQAISAAVVGALAVSLLQLAPHAVTDAFTASLLVLTVAGMMLGRIGALSCIVLGAAAGIIARLKAVQRLRELA